ncbi:MAG: YeeE/YedE family protein [Gammaproteobacteria bacterium]|nr:YeeE/YedE family protein [Gammaproteobacteria bacterium]
MDVFVWNPWFGGFMMGLFIILHFWMIGKPAGCSTGYGNICGIVCKKISYFHQGEYSEKNNPKLWLLVGIPIGGFLAAATSGTPWQLSFDMGMYNDILPQSFAAKGIWLIFGGILLGFGARLAGACTTGHALVGGAMMNPPSLLAAAIFFSSAIITTQLLFL